MFKKAVIAVSIAGSMLFTPAAFSNTSLNYQEVEVTNTLIPTTNNKTVIIEFFGYNCPHCYQVESFIDPFLEANKDKNIEFIRYPVTFPGWQEGAQLYFTLEAMGLIPSLHKKVYSTIFDDRKNITQDKKLLHKFLQENNVNIEEFESVYESFGVKTKMQQSEDVMKAYQITSTPVFVISNGEDKKHFVTSPAINQGYKASVDAIQNLIKN